MRTHPEHDRSRHGRVLTVALTAATLALPGTVHAQRLAAEGVRAASVTSARADDLDARAAAMEDTHRDSRDLLASAVLRESAARLRDGSDRRAVTSLRIAAWSRYYAGDSATASALLESAAARAAAMGDVDRAVATWLDAANVASELGQPDVARRRLEKAERLASSLAIGAARRAALQAAIARRFRQ